MRRKNRLSLFKNLHQSGARSMATASESAYLINTVASARCMVERVNRSRFNGFFKAGKPLKRLKNFIDWHSPGLKPRG